MSCIQPFKGERKHTPLLHRSARRAMKKAHHLSPSRRTPSRSSTPVGHAADTDGPSHPIVQGAATSVIHFCRSCRLPVGPRSVGWLKTSTANSGACWNGGPPHGRPGPGRHELSLCRRGKRQGDLLDPSCIFLERESTCQSDWSRKQ